MIRIDPRTLQQVQSARSPLDLIPVVQQAIRLEFATIPPYLTAMMSLHPQANRDVWQVIHDVVVDEMLHMVIVCNLVNALGSAPRIADPGFPMRYPGPLPLSIGDVQVGLESYSVDLVSTMFMQIEQPEQPIDIEALAAPGFATIGAFYAALADKLRELGPKAFVGDPARQVVAPQWFAPERLFAIKSLEDALRAIDLIVREGEGTSTSPLDPDGDVAHYYRFEQLVRGRRLVVDPTADSGFSYSGEAIAFDPAAVFRLQPNQRLEELDPETQVGRRANQFASTFSHLLQALQRTFDGEPAFLDPAMGIMFELKLAGQMLVSLPLRPGGTDGDIHAGPTFEYVRVNR